jgi:hypothetical protein
MEFVCLFVLLTNHISRADFMRSLQNKSNKFVETLFFQSVRF